MVMVGRPVSRKRFLLCTTAILAVVGGVVATCLVYDAKTLSEGELRSEVARELPLGSGQEEIFAFLERKGITGDRDIDRAGDYCCDLQDAGVPDETEVIVAIMHNTGPNTGLQLYFVLSADGTLGRFIVEDFVEFPL
jgi:hypothetical protein